MLDSLRWQAWEQRFAARDARCIRIALLLLVLTCSACSSDESKSEDKPSLRPVRVEAVRLAGGQRTQTLAGVARASKEMALSFRVAGTVAAINVKVGDEVKAEQIVARLDGRDARIEVARAKASLARAQAQARAAEANYSRLKLLYEGNNASRAELDSARSESDSAKASVAAEKSAVQLASMKTEDHVLRSRTAGVVAATPLEANENAGAGEPVVIVNAGDQLEVEAAVPESFISEIRKGAKATVHFKTIADKTFAGVVTEVGVSSSDGDTTFPMRVTLDEKNERIRAGMAATVTVKTGDPNTKPRIYVRPIAVQKDSEGMHVMVATPTGDGHATVKRMPVDVGPIIPGSGRRIKKGLKDGQLVIIAGLSQMSDGMTVRLLPDDQPSYGKDRLQRTLRGAARASASAAPPTPSAPQAK